MFAPGQTVILTTDGNRPVTIERSVGGGDFIVRTQDGRRFAVNSRQLVDQSGATPQHPGATLKSVESGGGSESEGDDAGQGSGEEQPLGGDERTESGGESDSGKTESPELVQLRNQLAAAESVSDEALAANLRVRIERLEGEGGGPA